MSTEKHPPAKTAANGETKEDRLAQALRANLRRRKAAARKPAKPAQPSESPAPDAETDDPERSGL